MTGWALLRISIVGLLIASPPERGELKKEIEKLANRRYRHPIRKGEWISFGGSTIERWYYSALRSNDPVAAVSRKVRTDAWENVAIDSDMLDILRNQYCSNPHWSKQHHCDNLRNYLKEHLGKDTSPSYDSVRRIMIAQGWLKKSKPSAEGKLKNVVIDYRLNNPGALQLHESGKKSYSAGFIRLILDLRTEWDGSISSFCKQVGVSYPTLTNWTIKDQVDRYTELQPIKLNKPTRKRRDDKRKNAVEQKRLRLLEIFHDRPLSFDINRSNWTQSALALAYYKKYDEKWFNSNMGRFLKKSGYTIKKARRVLTSPDPEYREKVELVISTLQNLKTNELFFFIDEMGPMRIKKYGGHAYIHKDEDLAYPQIQPYKGSITMAAAISATTNQITWLSGSKKDSQAMIDLIEILFNQHPTASKIYLTWDAASWHRSKQLIDWLDVFNADTENTATGPIIHLVPLPTSSQFLDVIESIFSAMKRAVIHHSDYKSKIEMKTAISRHFSERNAYVQANHHFRRKTMKT